MGRCTFCGKDAGFLRKVHQACRQKNESSWNQMISLATSVAKGNPVKDGLVAELGAIAEDSYLPTARIHEALIEGWCHAVNDYLDDHVLSEEEESQLTQYMESYSLSKEELDRGGSFTHMVQGATVRDILEGKLPSRVSVQGTLPFNLQKSESLVWVFQDVPYYETRTRRERVGGYSGASIRVMKGVYYHAGGFRSRSVERTETEHLDTGIVGITNKHIYFSGYSKKFRVPYSKIVTFEPYSDGVGVMRDAASAKPQTFVTGDGWFIYNLVTNLAQEQLTLA
jgi:hypothetical protein